MIRLAVLASLSLAASSAAGEFSLDLPVDCQLGTTCVIQSYVDADPGAGYQDFACGHLSYDTHKGTDFAVFTHVEAMQGIEVLAAASGVVRGVRDGLPDAFLGAKAPYPDGQDCGNGVAIKHADGYETQYCHLAAGSVTVRRGQKVKAGDVLGQIGMSGKTEFPHLHLSVRKDGKVVDPFDPAPDGNCGAPLEDQLWATPLQYSPTGYLQAGFSFGVPAFDQIKWGQASHAQISPDQGALVLWAHLFGTRAGDRLEMTISGPEGTFARHEATFEKPQAQAMRAAGRKLHAENTVPGPYIGTATLYRQGQEIARLTAQTELTD